MIINRRMLFLTFVKPISEPDRTQKLGIRKISQYISLHLIINPGFGIIVCKIAWLYAVRPPEVIRVSEIKY